MQRDDPDDTRRPLAARTWERTPVYARALTADRVRHRRLLRTAWLVTAGVLWHQGVLVADLVRRATSDDPFLHKSAAFALLVLALTSIGLGLVVAWVWRRETAARPVVTGLDATPGEAAGVPELDAPPGDHLGLHGHVEPPRRW